MRRAGVLLLLGLAILIPAASSAGGPGKVVVVATIPPLASIAEEVGGGRVEVKCLVPPGSDPHQFALRPSDLAAFANCDLLIAVGKEPFLGAIPEGACRLTLSWEDWERGGVYVRSGNPHYLWLYPRNAAKVARVICSALSQLDPEGAEYYEGRLAEFEQRVEDLLEWIERYVQAAGIEGEKVVLIGSHFEPLVECMGLKAIGILAEREGEVPSPEDVAKVEEIAMREGASAIIALASQKMGDEGRLAETISSDTKIPVVYVYGAMFDRSDTYSEFVKYTVASIASAVCSARSAGGSARSGTGYVYLAVGLLLLVVVVETYLLMRGVKE